MAGVSSIMAGAAFIKITMDNAELKRGVAEAQGNIKQLVNSCQAFSNKMIGMDALLTPPIIMAAKTYADFDDQMRLTAAVSGATGKQFEVLTEQAKKLGRETSFTAAQVAQGMGSLGRMGFNPKEIQAAIEPMMNLARATGTDLSEAAQIAANNLRVFKMETSKTSDVADILTVTANGSAQTLTDLGEALKMAGPHAARAGANLKETAGMLGVLANMGIRGSLAGTALGKSFKRMADPKVSDFLKQYGIETKDAVGDLRNMRDILVDVAKAMKNMKTGEQINFAEEVFDARGSLGGGTLSVNTEAIDEMMKKLENCKGISAQTAADMERGLGGAMRRLASAAEGVSLAFGEILAKTFGPVIESASGLCTVIAELMKDSTLLSGTLAVIGGFSGFAVIIKALSMLAAGIKLIFSPLLALDRLITGQAAKAAAAAKAEQLKQAATQSRIAQEIAAEKLKTANELAETAKRTAAAAGEEAAKLQALQMQKTANNVAIAESARVIAAKQAETAAIIAEEQKVIAAQTGKRGRSSQQALAMAQAKIQAAQTESAATIAAETEKQAAIAKTNITLAAQINAQNGVAVAAAKSALAANAGAAGAASDYKRAAAAATEAASAEKAVVTAQTAGTKSSLVRMAAMGKLSNAKLFSAACSFKHAKAVSVASIAELVAAKKSAGASAMKTAGYYAEAVGAKVAAGATRGLKAALDLLCAHPITIALLAASAAIWAISSAANSANKELQQQAEAAKEAAEEATKLREEGEKQRRKDKSSYKRLVQLEELAAQGKITNKEMKEAASIADKLKKRYGDLGITVDTTAKTISGAATAQKHINEAMKEAAETQIEAEISAFRAEQKALSAESEQASSYWNQNVLAAITGRMDEANNKIKVNGEKTAAIMKKIHAAEMRLKAMQDGDESVITGEDSQPDNIDNDNYEKEKQRQIASEKELAEAEKELARMEEDNAKKKMTQLESEVYEIEKLQSRYGKLADMKRQALLDEIMLRKKQMGENRLENAVQKESYLAAYEAAQKARQELDALNQRTQTAAKNFNQQKQQAQKREQEKRQNTALPFEKFLVDVDKKERQRQATQSEQKTFDKLYKDWSETGGGATALKKFMDALSGDLKAARQEYIRRLREYQSSGSADGIDLSDDEKRALQEIQNTINSSMSRLASYRDRIGDGQLAARQNTKTLAAFDARTFSGLFGQKSAKDANAERIAKATEDSEKHLRDILTKTGQLGWPAIS